MMFVFPPQVMSGQVYENGWHHVGKNDQGSLDFKAFKPQQYKVTAVDGDLIISVIQRSL